MRVLLSTIGTRGDVQPLVALALQLKALGADVRACVPPDYWARRTADLGIGVAHAPGAASVDSLTRALDAALQPGVAARARAIAATLRTDGARIAAARLMS